MPQPFVHIVKAVSLWVRLPFLGGDDGQHRRTLDLSRVNQSNHSLTHGLSQERGCRPNMVTYTKRLAQRGVLELFGFAWAFRLRLEEQRPVRRIGAG